MEQEEFKKILREKALQGLETELEYNKKRVEAQYRYDLPTKIVEYSIAGLVAIPIIAIALAGIVIAFPLIVAAFPVFLIVALYMLYRKKK